MSISRVARLNRLHGRSHPWYWSISGATNVTSMTVQFNIRSVANPVKAFPHIVCSLAH